MSEGENAIQKLLSYGRLGFAPNMQAVMFAVLAMAVMILWPKKLTKYLPGSLVAIIVAVVLNFVLNLWPKAPPWLRWAHSPEAHDGGQPAAQRH